MLEVHPFYNYVNNGNKIKGGFIPKGTKILIIGTFPPFNTYKYTNTGYFYYSSPRSHFWNRFDNLFTRIEGYMPLKLTKNSIETLEENKLRKQVFSETLRIGFIDIFSKIERKQSASSKDIDIISKETILHNGYLTTILETESIVRICCVYSLAYYTFKEWFLKNHPQKIEQVPDVETANKEKLIIKHKENKKFEVVLLFPASRSGQKGFIKDLQYKRFITQGFHE